MTALLAFLGTPHGYLSIIAILAVAIGIARICARITSGREDRPDEDGDVMFHRWLDEPGRPDAIDREIEQWLKDGDCRG